MIGTLAAKGMVLIQSPVRPLRG